MTSVTKDQILTVLTPSPPLSQNAHFFFRCKNAFLPVKTVFFFSIFFQHFCSNCMWFLWILFIKFWYFCPNFVIFSLCVLCFFSNLKCILPSFSLSQYVTFLKIFLTPSPPLLSHLSFMGRPIGHQL